MVRRTTTHSSLGSIVIDTYVNIICDDNGNIGTESDLIKCRSLSCAPYQFQLVGQIRFNNSAWLTAGPGIERINENAALRQGDRGALNMYVSNPTPDDDVFN